MVARELAFVAVCPYFISIIHLDSLHIKYECNREESSDAEDGQQYVVFHLTLEKISWMRFSESEMYGA